jgi:hypothetical protein
MSVLVAVVSLFAALALLLVPGGVLFAPFALGLSLLALVGALGGLEDRTVRQHDPPMNPRGRLVSADVLAPNRRYCAPQSWPLPASASARPETTRGQS